MKQTTELTTSQMNVEDPNNLDFSKNEKVTINELVEGTIFRISGNEETGYFVAISNVKVSPNLPTKEAAIKLIQRRDWNLIMAVVSGLILLNEQQKTQGVVDNLQDADPIRKGEAKQ